MTDFSADERWNPSTPVNVEPVEYEREVVKWLENAGQGLKEFTVSHLHHVEGLSGEYRLDAYATFEIFSGMTIRVIVECKRYARPVGRDEVLTLASKAHDLGMHKAIMFSTCGFQSGAIEYANKHGIALVIFADGMFDMATKSGSLGDLQRSDLPTWIEAPRFKGLWCTVDDTGRYSFSQYVSESIGAWLGLE